MIDFQQQLIEQAAVLDQIREAAHALHASVNQHYDGDKPYSVHLDMVADNVKRYGDMACADEADVVPLMFGAYFHDSIEDARLTYNDVRKVARRWMTEEQAFMAAELVYALTNDKGRTRAERAGEHYYAGIRQTPYAPLVKCADRLANMTYSLTHQKGANEAMKRIYEAEMPHFMEAIDAHSNDQRLHFPKEALTDLLKGGSSLLQKALCLLMAFLLCWPAGAQNADSLSITVPPLAPKRHYVVNDMSVAGAVLIMGGLVARGERKNFRKARNSFQFDFKSKVDNDIQYLPLGITLGLKAAGVEGRSQWGRLAVSSAMSYAAMGILVNGLKYTVRDQRPDGTSRNSFPSGHTATAFTGATILHHEYGLTRSPWYSVGGYALATTTGVMRVLNNRHWVSDVLAGAGIGILSTELGYAVADLIFKDRYLLRPEAYGAIDLRQHPSFFALSLGVGLGNKDLDFSFGPIPGSNMPSGGNIGVDLTRSTVVGTEAAWFFTPYMGIGGRLRVGSTYVKGVRSMAQQLTTGHISVESDHLSEFTADAGVYFSYPLTRHLALGSKLLIGRSIMDGIKAYEEQTATDGSTTQWELININGNRTMKTGTGISLAYAYKSSVAWRLFVDYDFSRKTFTAAYSPTGAATYESRLRKSLHTFVLGASFNVEF